MANLTLSIDDQLLKKARKVALEHDSSVNKMVRDYLRRVVSEQEGSEDPVSDLMAYFERTSVPVSPMRFSRDELHER
jgi:plasmid stability protein